MARMVRKQVYIDDCHEALLKEEVQRTGLTEAELIRRAIELAYRPDAELLERERRLRELDRAADELADAVAESGEGIHWPSGDRGSLYRRGDRG